MHACALAEELYISKIVVPPNPGLFSAYGLLAANFTCNLVQALMETAEKIEVRDLEKTFGVLHRRAVQTLTSQGVKPETMKSSPQLDMRYLGQGYDLTVPVSYPLTARGFLHVVESYHRKHKAIYGYAQEEAPVEIVNVRLAAVGVVKKPKMRKQKPHGKNPPKEALLTRRHVFFEKYETFEEAPVYLREKLRCRNSFSGPAVIEQYDATTVVYPEWEAEVDGFGNIVLTFSEGG